MKPPQILTNSIPSPTRAILEIGPLTIHFYALGIILGIIVTIFWGNRRYVARGGKAGVVADVAIIAVPLGIIGGRIYHVITSPAGYFGSNGNFFQIFFIWKGGLGIWGAISLGFAAAWWVYRGKDRAGISFGIFADSIAPGLVMAQAIGRWGNWFNIELFGKPTTLPWALQVPTNYRPTGYSQYETFHPTFLYESLWCVAIALLLVRLSASKKIFDGGLFAIYVGAYCFGRGFIEYLRIDDAEHILGLRINVWVSVLLFLAAMIFFFNGYQRAKKQSSER